MIYRYIDELNGMFKTEVHYLYDINFTRENKSSI